MKRLKSLLSRDKSRRGPNEPGYDVLPSDLSSFHGPTELPKVEQREKLESYMKTDVNRSSESILLPPLPTRSSQYSQELYPPFSSVGSHDSVANARIPDEELLEPAFYAEEFYAETHPEVENLASHSAPTVQSKPLPQLPTLSSQYCQELYPPFSSVGSHDSVANARIPDEELLEPVFYAETNPEVENLASHSAPTVECKSKEEKRRRRRESHNLVERRRRDNINDSIRTLAFLAPGGADRDQPKQAILDKAISWTRDLMWALHLKTQRESTLKNLIQELGGTPFMADTVDSLDNIEESIVEKEVQIALETNNITSFSSAQPALRSKRRASEPLKEHSIYRKKSHEHLLPRRLHKVTSRGSIISYVASVHSVKSLTYRSPTGDIETETREEHSNFSYFPNQLKQDQSRQEPNESNDKQDSCAPVASAMETLMMKNAMTPLATNEGSKATMESNHHTPEIEVNPHILGAMDENVSQIIKEDSIRKADPVAQCAPKVDDGGSISASVAAVNFEDAYKHEFDFWTHRRVPDIEEERDSNGYAELEDLLKKSNAGNDQDDARHGGRDANDVQHANCSAVYLDNGLVRLRWACSCKHPFQIDVLEHQKGAAVTAINELAHRTDQDESGLDLQYPLRSLSGLSEKIINVFRFSQASDESLPQAVLQSTTTDDLARGNPEVSTPGPDRYVCVCFPGITYKKYLHHVDVNRAANDPMLFSALKRKYFDWKPLWRRILTLRTLARVEYFEFKVFHSNLVTIKDDWRDRFPQGHGPEEWSYTPTTRDMTPYLIDDVLTHYVHNPECAKRGTYFWKRIPKKLFCQLECPDDRPFKVGWGLYFVEDFSQFYLMLILVPVLVGGVAVATWYCAYYGKSFADGATVASGFAALVMYMFSVAQGWAKQKGNI